MKKIVLLFSFFIIVASACKKQSETNKDSYEYFQSNLKAGMDYSAIVNAFGSPDRDIGSGIHIYVYNLDDGTFIWIGYTDKIMYARHVDAGGMLLHTII